MGCASRRVITSSATASTAFVASVVVFVHSAPYSILAGNGSECAKIKKCQAMHVDARLSPLHRKALYELVRVRVGQALANSVGPGDFG
jgi:hypothetical protein